MAPYRRPYKKQYRKPKNWYNRKYTISASPMQVAQQALRATRYIKGLVNSEMLHKDSPYSGALAAQYNITPLCNIAQGDTNLLRTGNSILLRNIYVRLAFSINASVTGQTRIMMALIKDTQQISDTQPAITDIFDSQTIPETMINLNNSGRFKIVWRKTNFLTIASGGKSSFELNKYFKVYDHVRYNGSTSTDIQKNGYYFVIVTSEATNYPSVDGTIRVGFHDN